MEQNVSMEMPRYKCHKEVWALKIKTIEGYTIVPEDSRYSSFPESLDYFLKHKPKAGGYYVQYEDGYKSFSPAEAFESGYERIS